MINDLGILAQIAYDAGIDRITFAEEQVAIQVTVHEAIAAGMFPGAQRTPEVTARRILGALLDAGWQPPVCPFPEPAQEAS
jgi:hypothetical protein